MRYILPSIVMLVGLNALADDTSNLTDARKIASAVPARLLQVLNDEIAKGGPESAIEVCREKAPQMAKAASEQSGWTVRRVSLKNRNPKAVPDAWERSALEDFDRRAAAGENPVGLEKWEVVAIAGRSEYRFIKALPVQPVCLGCHGAVDTLSVQVTEKLKGLYPADLGTGYSLGQIRGALTLRRPISASSPL